MPRDPLKAVLLLRRREVDEARVALGAAIAEAAEANERAKQAERTIELESRLASDVFGDDQLVEAFAAWLPGARHRAIQARSLHDRNEADVARVRAGLQACRSALEAIQALIDARAAREAAEMARRAQLDMDEAATRIRPPPDA